MAGGKLTPGIVDVATDMAALGLDPLKYLYTTNELERAFLLEVYDRLLKRREILDHNLAVAIATEVGRLISK